MPRAACYEPKPSPHRRQSRNARRSEFVREGEKIGAGSVSSLCATSAFSASLRLCKLRRKPQDAENGEVAQGLEARVNQYQKITCVDNFLARRLLFGRSKTFRWLSAKREHAPSGSSDHHTPNDRQSNHGVLARDDLFCCSHYFSSSADNPGPFSKAHQIRKIEDAALRVRHRSDHGST